MTAAQTTPYVAVAAVLAAAADREIRPVLPTVRVVDDWAFLETR